MKRDIELIRRILLNIEEHGDLNEQEILSYGYDFITVATHVEMLQQAGYLDAKVHFAMGHVPMEIGYVRLTWSGRDFLDACRSDNVWSKTKKVISDSVGTTTLEVLKQVCTKISHDLIMQQL